MRPIISSVGPLAAASATNIRTASSIAAAGPVTLNGTTVSGGLVATLDNPRRVLFTSSGNDSGISFTVTGFSGAGLPMTEIVQGSNGGTANTVQNFLKVTGIVASGASAGTVSIGTMAVNDTGWIRMDDWGNSYISIQCNVVGTVNYTIQSTLDDPNDPVNPVTPPNVNWVPSSDAAAVGATAAIQTNFLFIPRYIRCLLNSGSGSVSMTVLQAGQAPA